MNEEIVNYNTNLIVKEYTKMLDGNLSDFKNSAGIVSKILQTALRNITESIDNTNILKCRYDYAIHKTEEYLIETLKRYNYSMLKIMFYNLAEHIAEIHSYIYSKLYELNNSQYWEYSLTGSQFKELAIENGREFIEKINEDNMLQVTSILGRDKSFIQYIFLFLSKLNYNDLPEHKMELEEFFIIYECTIGICALIEERDLLMYNFNEIKRINVSDGIIEIPDKIINLINKMQKDNFYNSVFLDNTFDDNIMKKATNKFYADNGFQLDDLKKLFCKIINEPDIARFKITISPKNEFIEIINKFLGKDNGIKILDYLLLKCEDEEYFLKSLDKYDNRVFRKPFVEFKFAENDLIMYAPFILYYAYNLLIKDIRYGLKNTSDPQIIKKMNNKIVENIENALKNNKLTFKTNYEMLISGRNYEVDVIFVKNENLYIVECKDINPKFTIDSCKNDLRRLRKEYICNINLKEQNIKENIDFYKREFESDFYNVYKIIAYKSYTPIREFINKKLIIENISVFTEHELIEFIIK